jgi:hypothetical protein
MRAQRTEHRLEGRVEKKHGTPRVTCLVPAIALAFAASALSEVFNCSAGDSACLINSINAANANSEADTINLAAGTYTLTQSNNDPEGTGEGNGLPVISTALTIHGGGADTTAIERGSGSPFFRILQVDPSGSLRIESLTIRQGHVSTSAGGLRNLGSTTIVDSAVRSNTADFNGPGGISNTGTLVLTRSVVSGNSADDGSVGGISSNGSLTIDRSTVKGNSAGLFTGGIGTSGVTVITNSTITANSAFTGGPGGISAGGSLTIANSTVAQNFSIGGPGGISFSGSLQVNNSTIVDNRGGESSSPVAGGIQNTGSGTAEIQNTILARNLETGPFPDKPHDCFGSVTSLGHNIVGDPSDCTITLLASDKTGDPGLAAFEDDGSPGNGHIPLLATSQAIDAGDPASCTSTDQLGEARVDGNGDGTVVCDIGAIESIGRTFNCSGGDAACLIAAINSANADGAADTIHLEAGTYSLTAAQEDDAADGPSGLPAITSPLTITGADRATTIIQRDAGVFRIFRITAAGDLTLENLTLRRGSVSGTTTEGGGLLNRGKLTISNCTVTRNEALERRGGGISNYGSLTIRDSTISDNSADNGCCNDSAAGIFSNGSLTMSRSFVTGNHDANGAWGGIFGGGTSCVIESSTISGNSSDFGVGGVGCGSIKNSLIFGNSVQRGVGGVTANTIVNTTIAGNGALDQGIGGVGGGSLINCTVVGNFSADPAFGPAGVGTGDLKNTIVAGNTGGDCSSATSSGHNIIGDPTGCTINLLGSDLTGDPELGAFEDDGSPGNGHYPLLGTSRAVDAADPDSCSPTDQLGHARVDGNGDGTVVCDIGSVELVVPEIVNELVSVIVTKTSFDDTPVTSGPAGTFTIEARLKNISSRAIHDPVFRVSHLSGTNQLLNADGGPGGVGATLTPDVGADGVLSPGESITATFVIGLTTRRRFSFFVDVLGVPGP